MKADPHYHKKSSKIWSPYFVAIALFHGLFWCPNGTADIVPRTLSKCGNLWAQEPTDIAVSSLADLYRVIGIEWVPPKILNYYLQQPEVRKQTNDMRLVYRALEATVRDRMSMAYRQRLGIPNNMPLQLDLKGVHSDIVLLESYVSRLHSLVLQFLFSLEVRVDFLMTRQVESRMTSFNPRLRDSQNYEGYQDGNFDLRPRSDLDELILADSIVAEVRRLATALVEFEDYLFPGVDFQTSRIRVVKNESADSNLLETLGRDSWRALMALSDQLQALSEIQLVNRETPFLGSYGNLDFPISIRDFGGGPVFFRASAADQSTVPFAVGSSRFH